MKLRPPRPPLAPGQPHPAAPEVAAHRLGGTGLMRYRVRDAAGRELVVPTLRDLHDLYRHGFLADDDLVRSESSERWVPAGSMPALHGVRERRRDPRRMLLLLAAVIALVAGVALLLARGAPIHP